MSAACWRDVPAWAVTHGIVASMWVASTVHDYGWAMLRYEANLVVALLTRKWWMPKIRSAWQDLRAMRTTARA